jgi:hypothetical protein
MRSCTTDLTTCNSYRIYWGEGRILEDNAAMNAGLLRCVSAVNKTYRMLDRPL